MADKSKNDLDQLMHQLTQLLDTLTDEQQSKVFDHLRREVELLTVLAKVEEKDE